MSLNWREIDLVLDELNLPGAHIQRVVQYNVRDFYFALFHPPVRFTLHACLNHPYVRIHSVASPRKRPRSHQRFEDFLHSRITGGRVTSAEQLNHDRIVRLEIARNQSVTRLYIRMWGSHANIVATDETDRILDAAYRKPRQGIVSGEYFRHDPPEKPPRTVSVRPWTGSSFNSAIEREYHEAEMRAVSDRTRRSLEQRLAKSRGRLLARLAEIQNGLDGEGRAAGLQHEAELILANLHLIHPGDSKVHVPDYSRGGEPCLIRLESGVSPQEQANRLFERARRSRKSREFLSETAANLQNRLAVVDEQIARLPDTPDTELDQFAALVPVETGSRGREAEGSPGLRFTSNGHLLLVGRNAKENDYLLRRSVRGNDWWLHVRDYTGGYVFVKAAKGKSVPLDVLLDAGNLAIFFSKARSARKADLYYTQVKHLRRARNGPLGLVLPTQEKNLFVEIEPHRLERLGLEVQTI